MRIAITVIALVMMSTLIAGAVDNPLRLEDQIIVDRSTRSKAVNDYVFLTRDLIQRSWTTPVEMDGSRALKGHVSINYAVNRSGALESLQLIEGSGNDEMDRTLIEAIRKAAPFPPFPDEVAARTLFIRAKFIVADLPTIPVTTVEHKITTDNTPQLITPDDGKKFVWGTPAETSSNKLAPGPIPPRPPFKKFQWGRDK